jgi:hypothetical protein
MLDYDTDDYDDMLVQEQKVVFMGDITSQIIAYEPTEVDEMARKFANDQMRFRTRKGGFFTWRDCYNELNTRGTRLVLVTKPDGGQGDVVSDISVVLAEKGLIKPLRRHQKAKSKIPVIANSREQYDRVETGSGKIRKINNSGSARKVTNEVRNTEDTKTWRKRTPHLPTIGSADEEEEI